MKFDTAFASLIVFSMVLVPAGHILVSDSEASSLSFGINPTLCITRSLPKIDYARLKLLDQAAIIRHVVGPKDNVWTIHEKYGVDVDTLRSSNGLEFLALTPGQVLFIPNHRGTLYQTKQGDSLESLRKNFSWGRRNPDAFRKTVLSVSDFPIPDLTSSDKRFVPGSILFLPNTHIDYRQLEIPLIGRYRTTSGFGTRFHPILGVRKAHHGWDLAQPYGKRVNAAREGRIIFAGWSEGYGNMIEIRHNIKTKNGYNTITTRYGHLSTISVSVGDSVKKGQIIGRVGSTGISTGPNWPFEVRDAAGRPRNPWNYLQ